MLKKHHDNIFTCNSLKTLCVTLQTIFKLLQVNKCNSNNNNDNNSNKIKKTNFKVKINNTVYII